MMLVIKESPFNMIRVIIILLILISIGSSNTPTANNYDDNNTLQLNYDDKYILPTTNHSIDTREFISMYSSKNIYHLRDDTYSSSYY